VDVLVTVGVGVGVVPPCVCTISLGELFAVSRLAKLITVLLDAVSARE
jgi:hypothetical protein